MAPPVTAPISSDMGQARCPRSEWQHRKKSRFALLSTSEATSQNVCDGVRVLRTPLSCFEVFSGKSAILLDVVADAALFLFVGSNYRKQESSVARRSACRSLPFPNAINIVTSVPP